MNRFPASMAEKLNFYVYIYVDPRDGSVFYVGKGYGNRVFSHLKEEGEKAKHLRIQEIRDAGREPQLEILAHGLDEPQAKIVEAAIIDLLGRDNLTNEVRGWGSREYGRFTVEEITALYCETPAVIRPRDAVLLIRINQLYFSGMTPQELYEATRGVWTLSPEHARTVRLVFAVFEGVVREVYEVAEWFPAGTTEYFTRPKEDVLVDGRWEFVGKIAAEEIRRRYCLKSVEIAGQNPIRYLNC